MPRIKLASWYGDKAPGEEMEVDDVTLKALRRDGLVAAVLDGPSYDNGGILEPGTAVAVNDTGQPEAVETAPPAEGRRKR
ncbi:hypothetical protein [Streptomyces longwoodensis]|uniref:hypothetical protein n=1 Tax=Streptomyces longwoodensis TaxID=68231 RepID=UPI00381BD25F